MKKWLALLLAAMLLLPAAIAPAEEDDDWEDADGTDALGLVNYAWFKNPIMVTAADFGVKKGTSFPVYGAPDEEAWRGANGKASVSTKEPFRLLGWDDDKAWMLIEYSISAREKRIGWIHADCAAARETHRYFPSYFSRSLLRVTAKTSLTDDPNLSRRRIATLSPGDTVIGLCACDGWVCVETEIGGKPVWAFCKPDTLEEVPLWHLEGKTVVVHEGVTVLGNSMEDEWIDEDGEVQWRSERAPIGSIRADLYLDGLYDLDTIVLPDSLQYIGTGAFGPLGMRVLTIPPGVQISLDAAYALTVGELVVPADVADIYGIYGSEHVTVGRYTVAEGNPAYCDVDGVLFSADRKTLIRYPAGRDDKHYDVPAGTEVIANRAFDDDDVDIPLTTVSLPMGLKSIGFCAFSGCGRLVSITVPLTVTEIDEYAFNGCVSLEQISLPPGMSIEMNMQTGSGDYGRYHGDNGRTDTGAREKASLSWEAYLDNPEAEGPVTLYRDALCTRAAGKLPAGTPVRVSDYSRGAYELYLGYDAELKIEEAWAPADNVRHITGQTLFTVVSARFRPGAVPVSEDVTSEDEPDLSRPEEWTYNEWLCSGSEISFERPYLCEEEGFRYSEYDYVGFDINDVTLYRARTGDSRTLGILLSGEAGRAVWLCDAPEGQRVSHVWSGEQAEVLEAADGWLRVRIAAGRYWVPETVFHEVIQEAQSD